MVRMWTGFVTALGLCTCGINYISEYELFTYKYDILICHSV